MADDGKPFYRTEHVLRTIGGDETEFLVQGFTLTDVFDEGYTLKVRAEIDAANNEGLYEACSSRRLKDVEFFLRRRHPDGDLLEQRIAGLITAVHRVVSGEPGKGPTSDLFDLTIEPALALLKLDQQGGTWHNKSYADILFEELKKGLEVHGRTVRKELTGEYPEIEFTVRQPHESLYDFALKLMERTGINFYFDFASGVEVLVLCDTNEALPEINQKQSRDKPFTGQWHQDVATITEERFSSLSRDACMVPPAFEFLNSQSLTMPSIPIQGLKDMGAVLGQLLGALGGLGLGGIPGLGGGGGGGGGAPKGPLVSFHDSFRLDEKLQQKQVEQYAKLRAESESNKATPFEGESNITGAFAGRRVLCEVSPGDRKEYVLTRVEARGNRFDEIPNDYNNRVTCTPTVTEDGQPQTLRPTRQKEEGKHFGIYRAKVIAIENDPLDVDGFMRCRLEFPWDKQTGQPKPTYVSVLQPMAGTHGGTQWFPRAGDRVLVTFIGGNAEVPMILGSIYDNEYKPPLMGPSGQRLPAASSWLGWTYASIGDKARLTQLNMDVRAGQEMFFFNAPFDWKRLVGNDSTEEITRNETRKVKGKFDETVDKDWRHHVGGNRNETVAGNYSLVIDGSGVIEAKGGLKATIGGAMGNHYKSGVSSQVDGNLVENITSGGRNTRSSGPITFLSSSSFVARAPSVSVTVGGGGGMGAAAGAALDMAQDATLSAPRSSVLSAGGSQVKADSDGAHLRGSAVSLADVGGGKAKLESGKLVVDAPQGIEFRCGPNTLELTPDGLRINGMRVVIDAPQAELRTAAFDIVGPGEGQG